MRLIVEMQPWASSSNELLKNHVLWSLESIHVVTLVQTPLRVFFLSTALASSWTPGMHGVVRMSCHWTILKLVVNSPRTKMLDERN